MDKLVRVSFHQDDMDVTVTFMFDLMLQFSTEVGTTRVKAGRMIAAARIANSHTAAHRSVTGTPIWNYLFYVQLKKLWRRKLHTAS